MKKISLAFLGICLCVLSVGAAFAAMSTDEFAKLCALGTPQEIEAAIKSGADVNAKDEHYRTPIMWTAYNNTNPEVITTLVSAGADINAGDENDTTPLMWAAQGNSNPEVITALIKAGADVNVKNRDGASPLMWAAVNNPNPEVITTHQNRIPQKHKNTISTVITTNKESPSNRAFLLFYTDFLKIPYSKPWAKGV